MNKIIGINRAVAPVLTRVATRNLVQLGSLLDKLFAVYKTRVEADGGTLYDDTVAKTVFNQYKADLNAGCIKLLWSSVAGASIRTSGILDYYEKAYDQSTNNDDLTQTTEDEQPNQIGTIAPNELPAMLNPTGNSRNMVHDDIVVSGTYTIVTVLNTDQSGKADVTFTEVVSGTYNSITFDGELFLYEIFAGTYTAQQKTDLTTFFRTLYPEIPNVTIGAKQFQTSNHRAIATPIGNVIAEMTAAAGVEKLPQPLDFLSGYSAYGTIDDANSFTTDGLSGLYSPPITLTVGTWVKVTFSGDTTASSLEYKPSSVDAGVRYSIHSPVTGTFSIVVYYKVITGYTYFYLEQTAGIANVTTLTVKELGWADSQDLYDGLIAQGETVQAALEASGFWAYHNNDSAVGVTYSKIYNGAGKNLFVADIATQGAWVYHVATEAEWTALITNEEVTLKKEGADFWNTTGGTNATGFTAIGGAGRETDGTFGTIKNYVAFWCADSDKVCKIYHDGTAAEIVAADLDEGAYIRMVKD